MRIAFEFLYSNPKNPTLRVTVRGEETFVDAMVPLRIYKKKYLASDNKVATEAYYKTID